MAGEADGDSSTARTMFPSFPRPFAESPCFGFYPDEAAFRASEFVGLTEEEAHTVFQQRDTA